MSDHADSELDRLIALACDDLLEPSDQARLAAKLVAKPSARCAYLEAMTTERLLEIEHEDSLLSVAQAEHLVGEAQGSIAKKSGGVGAILTRGIDSPRTWALLSVAASLLLATFAVRGYIWMSYDPTVMQAQRATLAQTIPVGRVVDLGAARWDSGGRPTGPEVLGGERIRLLAGAAELRFNNGAIVQFVGPADFEVVSSTLVNAHSGAYCATAATVNEEFVIQTPTTQVVNVGPDLSPVGGGPAGVGVDIRDGGATEVVVFDGEVELQLVDDSLVSGRRHSLQGLSFANRRTVRHLGMGEALRVGHAGRVQRISSVDGRRFPQGEPVRRNIGDGVIRSVGDQTRDPEGLHYYRIVPGGFREDARAFVDRFHQWNGVDGQGLPPALTGADYVMAFNQDKWALDFGMQIELSAPATIYLLMDERVPTPAWLVERFEPTDLLVGLDEGWRAPDGRGTTLSRRGDLSPIETPFGKPLLVDARDRSNQSAYRNGVGPGDSIDATYRAWRFDAGIAGRVDLGPPGPPNERTSMYGILAVRSDAPTDSLPDATGS